MEQKKMEQFDRTNGIPLMRGRVEDNNDPMGLGRIKVRVHSIHGSTKKGTKTDDLPWANACIFSTSYNSGCFIIPEVNTTVWCLFEDGDENKIVYIGGMYGKGVTKGNAVGNTTGEKRNQRLGKNEKPDEASSLDKKVLYKSPKRAVLVFDDTKNDENVMIQDHLGQKITLKSPFKPGVSIANLESMDKYMLLDEKATIEIETINGSKITVTSWLEPKETKVEINLESEEKPMKFDLYTKEGTANFKFDKVESSIKDNEVEMKNEKNSVKMGKEQIDLKTAQETVTLTGTGNVAVSSGTNVTVSSGSVINLSAPVINLG